MFDSMITFWAKIPYQNIVSELVLFKNKITNYASLVLRENMSSKGLNLEEIPRFRSLEDQMSTAISGLLSLVGTFSKIINFQL